MASTSSAQTDPAELLALLWGSPGAAVRRGPARSRTLEEVVEAGIASADHGGLAAVTMRAVAGAIDVSTMALYSYVPGRDALVALMTDRVYLQMPKPSLNDLVTRDRLERVADVNRQLVTAHPWVADGSSSRPPLGPGVMAKYEYELGAFEGLGLDDVTTDDCLTYLLTFVDGATRAGLAATSTQLVSGTSDQEWWEQHQPLLARVFDEARFPIAARVGTASATARGTAYDPDQAYRFGLALTVDAICSLVPGSGDVR